MSAFRWLGFWWLGLLWAAAQPSIAAGEVKPVSISVELNLEGRYVPSALTLVVPLKRHVLLGAAPKDLDAGDRAAADFVEALARGDLVYSRARWDGPVEAAGTQAALPGQAAAPDTPLASYVSFMSTFRDVGVLGRVPSDDGELVLFRATSGGKAIVRAFRMTLRGAQWRFSGVNLSQRPADVFVMNTFAGIQGERQLRERIASASLLKAPGDLHRLAVNTRGVELQFRGERLGVDIPTLDAKAHVAARTVSARIVLVGNDQPEDLRRVLSTGSYGRFEQWRRTLDATAVESFAAAQTVARPGLFVMNLGSASIVFYGNKGDLLAHSAGPVAYEYVAHGSNRVEVANVFFESAFDDFLRSSTDLPRFLSSKLPAADERR